MVARGWVWGETQRNFGVESLCTAQAGEHRMLRVCQKSYSLPAQGMTFNT